MKAVVDTCIVIDVLQNREPFFENSLSVLHSVSDKDCDGFLTAKSITDIFYIIRKSLHNDKSARECIRKLYSIFTVVDTLANDCEFALYSETSDYEDAVMIETAKRIDAGCIVTRNQKDYTKSEIPVYSPEELLAKLDKE